MSPVKTLILVFANYNYLPVLNNWLAAVEKIQVKNYLIISLDKELHLYLKENDVHSRLIPCEQELGKLWIHRVNVIYDFMKDGFDIIHSDADAVWFKDPQPYINKLTNDLTFSQGTFWPKDVHQEWGFVLCCGFYFIRNNNTTMKFMKNMLLDVQKTLDDQLSCNRLLFQQGTTWYRPENMYSMKFRGVEFHCSRDVIEGYTGDLSLAILPHSKFQRIEDGHYDVYIKHIISEKNSKKIMDVLQENDCIVLANHDMDEDK